MTMANPDPNHYDLLILGSGEAGKFIAWTIAPKLHYRTAVIERRYLGGSCPKIACLPSKNFIHYANILHAAEIAHTRGILDAGVEVEMMAVIERKREMVRGFMEMHEGRFKDFGVEDIWGQGRFVGKKKIEVVGEVGQRLLTADRIVVRTGSRAKIDVPTHLIVLGGGYIGLEFTQAMRRLRAKVTVIERNARMLKKEDIDITDAILSILEKEGVKFHTETIIQEVSGQPGSMVTFRGTAAGKPFEVTGSHILCATGRFPNTEDIGLEEAGIKLTEKGFVETNENLRTSSQDVFAVGDCAGSPNFTHIAFDDFRIVRDILLGKPVIDNRKSGRQVPFTLFTTPELAHAALREHEALSRGIKFRISKLPMKGFLKTRALGETSGFAKVLIAEDDTILGFTALGVGAGDLLPFVQLAMKRGLPYTDIAGMVITHPTLSEGMVFLFSGVPAKG